jgi:hypothetical protein
MKKLIFICLIASIALPIFASEPKKEENPNQQSAETKKGAEKTRGSKALPKDIPFKKSLTLTTTLLFDTPYEDTKMVKELTDLVSNYMVLESKAISVVKPLKKARKDLKTAVQDTIFKNGQDLNSVIAALTQDTDEETAHNLQELHRDKLIKFDATAKEVLASDRYNVIKTKALKYQATQKELKANPLFAEIESVRKKLKPLMHQFLLENFKTMQDLEKAFNEPIDKVNVYLRAQE